MIVTVTANTTLDQALFIPGLEANKTLRATNTVLSMAGKPCDAAWVLSEMGITSLALGFRAGVLGDVVQSMLRSRGIMTDFITVGGQTRLNTVIIGENDHSHTTITTNSLIVNPEHIAQIKNLFQDALIDATCVIMGGTLPGTMQPSFYTDMIKIAREKDVPVIFDADEPNLSAGLQSSPTYIKPNKDELSRLIGKPVDSLETAYAAGREIVKKYGTSPIITMGDEGVLAVLPDKAYRLPALKVDVVSPAGAGDAVLAGLAASLYHRKPIEEGLRLGVACATAVLLQQGTAVCQRADIDRFLPQVEIAPYPAP